MDQAAVCAALGVTTDQLTALMSNPQFPQPTGGLWNADDIAAFGALMIAAYWNKWDIRNGMLATADFEAMAGSAAPVGPWLRQAFTAQQELGTPVAEP